MTQWGNSSSNHLLSRRGSWLSLRDLMVLPCSDLRQNLPRFLWKKQRTHQGTPQLMTRCASTPLLKQAQHSSMPAQSRWAARLNRKSSAKTASEGTTRKLVAQILQLFISLNVLVSTLSSRLAALITFCMNHQQNSNTQSQTNPSTLNSGQLQFQPSRLTRNPSKTDPSYKVRPSPNSGAFVNLILMRIHNSTTMGKIKVSLTLNFFRVRQWPTMKIGCPRSSAYFLGCLLAAGSLISQRQINSSYSAMNMSSTTSTKNPLSTSRSTCRSQPGSIRLQNMAAASPSSIASLESRYWPWQRAWRGSRAHTHPQCTTRTINKWSICFNSALLLTAKHIIKCQNRVPICSRNRQWMHSRSPSRLSTTSSLSWTCSASIRSRMRFSTRASTSKPSSTAASRWGLVDTTLNLCFLICSFRNEKGSSKTLSVCLNRRVIFSLITACSVTTLTLYRWTRAPSWGLSTFSWQQLVPTLTEVTLSLIAVFACLWFTLIRFLSRIWRTASSELNTRTCWTSFLRQSELLKSKRISLLSQSPHSTLTSSAPQNSKLQLISIRLSGYGESSETLNLLHSPSPGTYESRLTMLSTQLRLDTTVGSSMQTMEPEDAGQGTQMSALLLLVRVKLQSQLQQSGCTIRFSLYRQLSWPLLALLKVMSTHRFLLQTLSRVLVGCAVGCPLLDYAFSRSMSTDSSSYLRSLQQQRSRVPVYPGLRSNALLQSNCRIFQVLLSIVFRQFHHCACDIVESRLPFSSTSSQLIRKGRSGSLTFRRQDSVWFFRFVTLIFMNQPFIRLTLT